MGPRTSIRGNSLDLVNHSRIALLQWGRGLPSAETCGLGSAAPRRRGLQWGRGLPSAETETLPTQAWAEEQLQWGRGLPSAETRIARFHRRVSLGFNGAADFHPRKPVGRVHGLLHVDASMGPRTSIRGNMRSHSSSSSCCVLQWGRGLPSAETCQGRQPMRCCACFNGAADFHPRKRTCRRGARGARRASMGPRTSIRGNMSSPLDHVMGTVLQWGRGLPSAETRRSCVGIGVDDLLQWGRGLPSAETLPQPGDLRPARAASMGPRTSIRGNPIPTANVFALLGALQWGRGLPSAETECSARSIQVRTWLQWGRGLPSAETACLRSV